MDDEPAQGPDFDVQSMYGAFTKRGLVQVTLGSERVLVPPAKAREMAQFMIEAATAAETDEILMRTLERTGVSLQRSAMILQAVRQERLVVERRARSEARSAYFFDQEMADLDRPEHPA